MLSSPTKLLEQWQETRSALKQKATVSQSEVNRLIEQYHSLHQRLRPGESDEWFDLVNDQGEPYGVTAPRWLCHAGGLRHYSVNAVIRCANDRGAFLLLQLRSWNKDSDPGCLDLAVGGHPQMGVSPEDGMYQEMQEEIGLEKEDLVGGRFEIFFAGKSYNEKPAENNFNKEWCIFYRGAIRAETLEKIHFSDGEVGGLFLFPEEREHELLNQQTLPLAGCLKSYLSRTRQTAIEGKGKN